MNTKLLRRVQKAILKHPGQFEMCAFFSRKLYLNPGETHEREVPVKGCGTAACIAGWAVAIAERNSQRLAVVAQAHDGYRCGTTDTPDAARSILLLDSPTASKLFYVKDWPHKYSCQYIMANTVKKRAKAASDRISHFIQTKGKE